MSTTTSPVPAVGRVRRARPPHSPRAILIVILTAHLMGVIDLTIVNVAAPTIRSDLHTSGSGIQLVIAGYVITYAMMLITGARLGDRYGHGRALRVGLMVFTLRRRVSKRSWSNGTSNLIFDASAMLTKVPSVGLSSSRLCCFSGS